MRLACLVAVVATLLAGFASPADAKRLSPRKLLDLYQPVTVLDAQEAFAPSDIEGFIANSDLQRRGEDGTFTTVESPASRLPVEDDGWRLDFRGCTPATGLPAVGCYAAASSGPSTVYGRFAKRAGANVLQYWFFYDDDFWSLQYPPTNLVWQAHEGDWEEITIVLDEQQQPVEAAYSQHCTGERRPWAAVPKAPGTSNPLVFVATGSHANLFSPGTHAISLSCYPPEAVAFFQQFGVAPLDVNVPGRTLGPGSTTIERIREHHPRWVRFPGTWGETQFVSAPPPIGLVPFGTSPAGPAFHAAWIDPLGTIAGWPTA